MKNWFHRGQDEMLTRLFFKLLPVQASIVAMGAINSIVNGIVAGRFIDATTVGVIGLYYTMTRVLEAVGAVLLGGVSVLSGRYLGSGRIDRTRGVCSLGLAAALIFGTFMTAASLAVPGTIADLLGSTPELKGELVTYIRGYAIGIIPLLLGQQLAAALQLERREKLGQAAILTMITVNVILDLVFVAGLKLGIWGLALATSLANWSYFLVVAQYYLTKKAQLAPSLKLIDWKESASVFRIGFPNALITACLAARSLAVNRILLKYSGGAGLSALSAFNMISGLILSVPMGTGALVRMLTSVFLGEENRDGVLSVIRITLTRVMALILAITAGVILLAPAISGIFFPDRASLEFRMASQLFVIFGGSIPGALLCLIYFNYCQAAGHQLFVNLISLVDGFFSVVAPAILLAPGIGALGVWLSFPIGIVITLICSGLYSVIRIRRWPRSLEEWLMLPPEFGTGKRLVMELHSMEDVVQTSERAQTFCNDNGISAKAGAYTGLCLEELAGNIVNHGFQADRKPHTVEAGIVLRSDGKVVLRIKDDCIPFNPQECYEMTSYAFDPFSNVGIRLVYGVADEVNYQNMLGLNVLTVLLSDRSFS